jgi:ribonuclease P protein component
MKLGRLRKAEFADIYRKGRKYSNELFKCFILPGGTTAVACVAGRMVGNAVRRNRAKRLLRAALQCLGPELNKIQGKLVLQARTEILRAKMQDVRELLSALLKRSAEL